MTTEITVTPVDRPSLGAWVETLTLWHCGPGTDWERVPHLYADAWEDRGGECARADHAYAEAADLLTGALADPHTLARLAAMGLRVSPAALAAWDDETTADADGATLDLVAAALVDHDESWHLAWDTGIAWPESA